MDSRGTHLYIFYNTPNTMARTLYTSEADIELSSRDISLHHSRNKSDITKKSKNLVKFIMDWLWTIYFNIYKR